MSAPPTVPTVSVVMAAYNGASLIEETLASLSAQTLTDWEAIVVDDCSTDDTRQVVARWPDPRVRLFRLAQNGGPVRARNHGVAEARGRYIAGLDHDDIALPERFARQVAYLDAHPEIALLGTGVAFLRDGSVRPSTYPVTTSPAVIGWLTWIENPLAWSSVMIRGDAARALHPFTRPELLYAEDFDLYHRIRPHGGIARLDDVLLRYRQHAGGVSKRFADRMEGSATRVLVEAHAGVLGDEAGEIAALLAAHHLDGRPVPDRATYARLGDALARLQAAYLDRHAPSDADRRLIAAETARRWARIGRAGLREGTLTLADVLATRPPNLGIGDVGPVALARARAVGFVRNAFAQTLAAKIIRPGPSDANT